MVKISREGRVLIPRGRIRVSQEVGGGGVIGNWGQCQRRTMEAALGVGIRGEEGQSGTERSAGMEGFGFPRTTAKGLAAGAGAGLAGQDRV